MKRETKKQTTIVLKPSIKKKAMAKAEKEGYSFSQIMENLLLKYIASFFLIITSFSCFSQDAPKGSNQIIVKNIDFRKAINGLLDKGYNVALMDSSFQIVTSGPHDSRYGTIILHIRIKDNDACITGEFNSNMSINLGSLSSPITPLRIENKGMKGSPLKISWNDMNDFAASLGNEIIYNALK